MTKRKTATSISANVLTKARARSGMSCRTIVSRRCSARSIASAAPSIASHRNAIEAISSAQMIGVARR